MQLQVLNRTQCTTGDCNFLSQVSLFNNADCCLLSHAKQIVRSLNERITGSFVDLTVLDIDSLSHYFCIQSHFTAVVETFKGKHPNGWEMFVKEVLCAVS